MIKWLISSKLLQLHNFSQICCSSIFYLTAHGVRMGGRAGCGKKFVQTVSHKLKGKGIWYLVGTFVRMCRCATSRSDPDLTFDLATETLSLKILSKLYLGKRKV